MNNRLKLISKIILGFFSIMIFLQFSSVYALEDLPIITIDFVSGNIIDLDKNPQMIRADVQIQNYDPQHGYHFMEVSRLNDGEIIKSTEILPKVIEDNLFGVQILHYLDPDDDESSEIGDYTLRIFSEHGPVSTSSMFSIVKSSVPKVVTQNATQEVDISEESLNSEIELLETSDLEQSESKIPVWVHDIFVWYADETISENELLSAIQYLISQDILDVD